VYGSPVSHAFNGASVSMTYMACRHHPSMRPGLFNMSSGERPQVTSIFRFEALGSIV
jgi:hypothetical protein